MEIAHTKDQQIFINHARTLELRIDKVIEDGIDTADLDKAQRLLDKLAEKYQDNEKIGSEIYRLFELQAILHYYNGENDKSLEFINHAIKTRGASYPKAEKLKSQLIEKEDRENDKQLEIPLELQARIRGLRSSTIIMAVVSVISIYFIPWAVYYIILATKLKPEKVPNSKQIKIAAIATLPLCMGLIPILVDIEYWGMNKRLKIYEEHGNKADALGNRAFMSDEEYIASAPKRKKRKIILYTILTILITALVVLIAIGISSYNSSNSSDSTASSEKMEPYVSAQHGFTVNFPGIPTTEQSNIDVDGVSVPYAQYTKSINNDNIAYTVQVVNYPASDFDLSKNQRGVLDGAINGAATGDRISVVNSTNNGTFLGYPSAEATYSGIEDGQTYEMHALGFIKGNDLYLLFTVGENKMNSDNFIRSFRLN